MISKLKAITGTDRMVYAQAKRGRYVHEIEQASFISLEAKR